MPRFLPFLLAVFIALPAPKRWQRPFDSQIWRVRPTQFGLQTRYFMVDDLRSRYLRPGTGKDKWQPLLGKPDYHDMGRGNETKSVPVYKLFRLGEYDPAKDEVLPIHRPILRVYTGPDGQIVKTEIGVWLPQGLE